MSLYGYARVSTSGQDLGVQIAELTAAGCTKIFEEKVSGAVTERRQLRCLLRCVQAGDVVLVTRLDRLARSTRDLLNIVASVTQKGALFRSLGDAWADTTTPHGRLLLTVLGGLAEFERHLIRQRTMEGRARARARGVKFGRPSKLSGEQRRQALARRNAGESESAVAASYRVSRSTIARLHS
jgi:DNA invertase Pin-like site-specific DNA recombinase